MAVCGQGETCSGPSRDSTRRRFRRQMLCVGALCLVVAFAVACGDSSESPAPEPSATQGPAATASPAALSDTVWLCRPGLADNPCETDLTTTVVSADGTSASEPAAPAEDPPVDCFYVYPTVSMQPTQNADLSIDPEVRTVAIQQAARFSQVCRVYAPVYRQVTIESITSRSEGDPTAAGDLAYDDVLSAWQEYLANYNGGRGVVFIGHSQGTAMLTRLIASEIDRDPELRRLLVSALLLGGNVTVAAGQDAGGDFENVPACRSDGQTGCVVAYSSFNQTPPPDGSFGRAGGGPRGNHQAPEGLEVLCTNPAALTGGTGPLRPYYWASPLAGVFGSLVGAVPPLSTAWVAHPGLYTAHCESSGGVNWLQVDATNVPGDQRPVVSQVLGPTWGLHLVDVNIALGNLVDLVRQQAAAFSR